MTEINIGYTGQRRSSVCGQYLLGKGYRGFNPMLKRFASQDNMSPFGLGGEHGFAYCGGNPVNRNDPSGHFWGLMLLTLFMTIDGAEEVSFDVALTEAIDSATEGKKNGPLMAYENRELPQRALSPDSIFRLEKVNDQYKLINMVDEEITETPNGSYLFIVRARAFTCAGEEWVPKGTINPAEYYQDEENILRVIRAPEHTPAHPGEGYGHTSMAQIKIPTRSLPVSRVYYAGELTFSDGKLTSWSNKSGHYRPAGAKESLLPSVVERLLPPALYTGT